VTPFLEFVSTQNPQAPFWLESVAPNCPEVKHCKEDVRGRRH
jgi:hypothetical protein